jgi:hypothetical protein
MAKCNATPQVVDRGVAFGATAQEAKNNADSDARGREAKHPCPKPCLSWYRVEKRRPRPITEDDYRKIMDIDPDLIIVAPDFKCVWELLRKCENPPAKLY